MPSTHRGTPTGDNHRPTPKNIVRPRIADLVGWHNPNEADADGPHGNLLANKVSRGQTDRDRRIISNSLNKEYGARKTEAKLNAVKDPEMREYMEHHGIENEHEVDEDDMQMWHAVKNSKNNKYGYEDNRGSQGHEDRYLDSMWEDQAERGMY